jgi:hypothetical protein
MEPPPMDGASMTPLMTGVPERLAREVYAESLYPERFGWAGLHSLRTGHYKVIDAPRPELFDLGVDPREQRNLAGTKPELTAAMLGRLRSLRTEAETPVTLASADPAVSERIASLGYVSGAQVEPGQLPEDRPDPKDTIDTYNQMTRTQWARRPVHARTADPCSVAAGM